RGHRPNRHRADARRSGPGGDERRNLAAACPRRSHRARRRAAVSTSSTTAGRPEGRLAPDPLAGAAMIVGTSASIQIAAALAHDLFATLGPAGTSALRFTLGAAMLFAVVRPRIGGRDGETWWAIARYGVSMAVLNLTFFEA